MSTVGEHLTAATNRLRVSGSPSPRLDAELLLAFAIGVDRTAVLAHPDAPVGADAAGALEAALARRASGEPVAYIRGLKEFYGLAFTIDRRALIPRPETELLVELAEREIAQRLVSSPRPPGAAPMRIADVGTGPGTVAVSLAVVLRRRRMADEIEILAIDSSADALQLARENAVGHGIADRLRFVEADILPPVAGPFEIVVANLPYIPSDEVDRLPIAASFEPRVALDGGPDGLDAIRALVERLPDVLAAGGVAFFEIGAGQLLAIEDLLAARLPGWVVAVHPDLAGHPRVVRLDRPA